MFISGLPACTADMKYLARAERMLFSGARRDPALSPDSSPLTPASPTALLHLLSAIDQLCKHAQVTLIYTQYATRSGLRTPVGAQEVWKGGEDRAERCSLGLIFPPSSSGAGGMRLRWRHYGLDVCGQRNLPRPDFRGRLELIALLQIRY